MKNADEMNEKGSEKSETKNIIFIVSSSFRNFLFLRNFTALRFYDSLPSI